jgi:hypothetical protein
MATRVVSGVLAIAGAVVVAVGGYVPYAQEGTFKLRVFETKEPHAILFFAIEPAAVAIAAVVLGILLLVHGPLRITPGILLGTGVQTALYFVGFVGYYAQSTFGTDVKAGGWIGMLGGVVIAAAGGVSLAARDVDASATQRTAAGWYADPGTPSRLRYWSGAAWTEHTHPASPGAAPASSLPPGSEAPG